MLLQYVYRSLGLIGNSSSSQWKWGPHSNLKLDQQRGEKEKKGVCVCV